MVEVSAEREVFRFCVPCRSCQPHDGSACRTCGHDIGALSGYHYHLANGRIDGEPFLREAAAAPSTGASQPDG